jgi:tRNA pseudouridine13 synthase
MSRTFFMNHSPIDGVHFTKNSSDFIVNEIPLYSFSGEGEHAFLHIRKKDLTTWQMLNSLSEACGAKVRDFGYAGLKDKDGMTTQYVSIHKSYLPKIESFSHEKIKILSTTLHENKLKIGHLKGNRFFIRLKKVLPTDALKLEQALKRIQKEGFPNYFGYQRFGKEKENYAQGLEILEGKRRERNRKIKDLLISAFQSHLFNQWLSNRIEISKLTEAFSAKELPDALGFDTLTCKALKAQKPFMKLFDGDICHHYPHGKAYICEDSVAESARFEARDITLAGWLPGARGLRAQKIAGDIEAKFYEKALPHLDKMTGARRYAWSFAEDIEWNYRKEEAWFEMHFTLQKGSYATVVLEEILRKELQ